MEMVNQLSMENIICKRGTVNSSNELEDSIKAGLKMLQSKRKFKGETELPYPMSQKYGQKDWNILSALREYLSNMLDTKCEYSISYKNGFAVISDLGKGLPQTAFIFGESERDDSQIGQFGEGLKMACLTMLRLNRRVWMETVGFTVLVDKVSSDDVIAQVGNAKKGKAVDLMEFRFIPNKKTLGTDIFVECTEEELTGAKNLFLTLKDVDKVDKNIFLPAGEIYLLGLKTTNLPKTLFSYNIEDKTMSNRDRNMIDVSKLQEKVIDVMKEAKNQAFIKEYLTAFKTNPGAFEYQLAFMPMVNKRDVWKKVLNKVYPKACLSSDIKSDLYAHMMGYTVLRNIPTNVLNVLNTLGLKDSSVYAKNYKGEGIRQSNKIIFPVSENYVGNWKREQAIREFISNALDAGDKIRITHNGTEARISDNGTGIARRHFAFGISEKSSTAIGKWGEGIKVGCLVLARTGSPVKIETVGYTYEAKLEYNKDFGMKLLVVYFNKNSRTKGTSIVFKCSESELESSKGMFVQLKGGKRKTISNKEMDVYLDNPGLIYSNGLETAKVNAMFSYNIKNKDIVISRDRNTVDTDLLSQFIKRFLTTTTDETVIYEFLTKWETKSSYIEYLNSFSFSNETLWKKIAKKAYPKACFATYDGTYCYDRTNDDDFIAKSAGYKLLYKVPDAVKGILVRAGIEKADVIARKFRGKSVIIGDTLIYPMTKDFGKNWSIIDAIKELISNSIDTGAKTSYTYKNGFITISDKGEGLSKKNLLFSGSSKKENQIGTFGEGLKIASLVLARNNRDFKVTTKGFEYTATIQRDTQFNADVLVVKMMKSKKRVGTDIIFKGTEKELNDAKTHFLQFNSGFKFMSDGLYTPGGYIFVNGVYIQKINSLFTYNITGAKEIISRDRKSVDLEKSKPYITKIISTSDNKKMIEDLITNKDCYKLENQLLINPVSSVKDIWKQIVKKIYGKCCFATGTDYDGVARDKGFTLINGISEGIAKLLSSLGVMSSSQVVSLKGDEKQIKKRFDAKKLSQKGKKRFSLAKELFTELYSSRLANKIELVESFKDEVETDSTWGLYNSITDTIYVLAEIVDRVDNYAFDTLMGVLIHEQVHRKSGAYDRTREFENALSMELGRIATLLFKSKSSKQRIQII